MDANADANNDAIRRPGQVLNGHVLFDTQVGREIKTSSSGLQKTVPNLLSAASMLRSFSLPVSVFVVPVRLVPCSKCFAHPE